MKCISIKTIGKMVKQHSRRGNGRTMRTAWYNALLVLGTALLMLTGCPETPAEQSDTTAPDPIAITSANITTGPSSIGLQWEPSPSDDVAIVQVTWTPTHGEDQPKLIDIDSTNTTITGLNAGVTYTFSITAIDTSDNVSSVAEISATTASAVVFAQEEYSFTDLDVAPGTTVGSVSATITPADPSITLSYQIMENNDDDSALFVIDSTTAEITVGAAVLDTERGDYSFTVQVTSSQGIIVTTAVVVSPTPSAVDFAQDSYSFSGIRHTSGSTVGSVSATVAPADPSITLSYQIVENNDDDSALFVIDSTTAEITVGAAVLDTERDDYSFTVQVTSSQGVIVTTTVVASPLPLDTTAPDPLTEVDATTTAGTTAVTLSWKNSASADATIIRIVWTETASGTGGGSRDITDVTTTRFDVTGLTSEVEYTFTLTVLDDAVDAAGAPDPNESDPETDTATTPDINAPSPVGNFTATPLAGGTEIELRWTNSNSVDAATLDIAWTSSTNGVESGSTAIPSGTGMGMHTISGLILSTPYTVTITVIDDANNRSDTETATPDPVTTLANPIDTDGDTLIDINTLEQLHNMRYNLNGTSYKTSSGDTGALCGTDAATACRGYELTQSLNFDRDSDNRTYNAMSYVLDSGDHHATYFPVSGGTGGWFPIGDADNPFSTIFEGNGFFIRGLAVRRNQTYVGMFGRTHSSAIIRNIRLTNSLADYTGDSGSNIYVGGLVAYNAGTISASHAGGPADGGSGNNDRVGGLVGRNTSTIIASYATGDADGGNATDNVGGLVAWNTGTIVASYATGDVDGGEGYADRVGGLVGNNDGTIIASYATGNADGGGGTFDDAGGLVGQNEGGMIIASYATGDADGGSDNGDRVGGLVGYNFNSTITTSYATGNADGGSGDNDSVGSLVVQSGFNDTVTASYGFGSIMNSETDGLDSTDDLDPDAVGAGNDPGVAGARRLRPAGQSGHRSVTAHWNQASSNTQNAWNFGTDSEAPALRYADYDGTGGNTYGCGSSSTATIVIPDRVPVSGGIPGGFIDVTCASTLLGGPQPR